MRHSRDLTVSVESFALARPFIISRGTRTHAEVVTCTLRQGAYFGRGECTPYPRYGESVDSVASQIEAMLDLIDNHGLTRIQLLEAMPAGAARNAIDCAMWDLESKIAGKKLLTGNPVNTVYTLSLDTPENMVEQALSTSYSDFKVKLGGKSDDKRLLALRKALPHARMIIDANEGWTCESLNDNLQMCLETGVALIEQPLPAKDDEYLRQITSKVPLCADESLHTRASLASLKGKYSHINIKLDKAGGLTEALLLKEEALKQGFKIMVGCMICSSLGIAPAFYLAQGAEFVDLDAPLLLKEDRSGGLLYEGAKLHAPSAQLWG